MEMKHRIAIAVIISIVILIGYNFLFPPEVSTDVDGAGETDGIADTEGVETEGVETEGAADTGANADGDTDGVEKVEAPEQPEPAAPVSPDEQVERVEHRIVNDLLAITVDNQSGGLITKVEPLAEQFAETDGSGGIDFLLLRDEDRTLDFGFVADETDFAWKPPAGQVKAKTPTSFELSRRQGEVEVVETLTLLQGYEAKYEVVVRNHGAGEVKHRVELGTYMGVGEQSRYDIHRALCRTPEDMEDFDVDDVEEDTEKVKGGLEWFALDSKYFLQAVIPAERMSGCVITSDERGADDPPTAMIAHAIGRQITLGPGEQKRYEFGLYIGAKVDSMLGAYPESEALEALPDSVKLTEAIDWGWFGKLSEFLGSMMLSLLRWFYSLTGIWGVAIIMLTVVVKLTLLPLTIKQYSSMRKMKELQPEMEKIREKYGEDKVKQQQEMQALFQRKGVSPLSGCAPMVLQFPVWIALYAMLGAVVDLYHEPFLWLPDMTQPDPIYILPAGMGILMFIQTRMNPTAGDAQQAKMMQWMMPGIFVVMMLFLPSGLGVYIFANIVLSLIQSFIQLRIKKGDGEGEGKDAGDKSDKGGKTDKGGKGGKGKKKSDKKD